MSLDDINHRLVEAARDGQRVVRLKSGDPFVFGRGGEELAHLRAAGVRTFVVPGITAALGCAAEAGLPLTFRDEATRLCLVTAHTTEGAHRIDWSPFAAADATVVVYMGLSAAAAVQAGLLTAGRDPATPAAVLVRGTQPQSQALVGRLDALARLATQAGEGPALVVVGQVVARCEAWRAAGDSPAQAQAQAERA
jgi:uroporphyrin-III C-methyltransferase/precorrin-2 dehydrogenase/sirohydrochlorin ferrochelatase